MIGERRYEARYRNGYYVVIDTHTGEVVPPPAGHYQRYEDGYLWDNAAAHMANHYNEREPEPSTSCEHPGRSGCQECDECLSWGDDEYDRQKED